MTAFLPDQSWDGETETADDDRPIRQGDVIRWEVPEPPWQSVGVIVTADCDIAQRKHGEWLSYVPVLPLREYWRLVTLPRKIEMYVQAKFERGLFEKIRALKKANRPEFPGDLSDGAIRDLSVSTPPEKIAELLGVPFEDRPILVRNLVAYADARSVRDDRSVEELVTVLATLKSNFSPSSPNGGAVMDELVTEVRSLPGDAFFVGKVARVSDFGFVAYLRLIRETTVRAVAIRPSDLRSGATGRRIARLRVPYIHRLTQQLGAVFSDIGLPVVYEERRLVLAAEVRTTLLRSERTS